MTKTRTDLLNFLAEKYNLERYLELGVQDPTKNLDKIKCRLRIGVDPDPKAGAGFQYTSDQFFELFPWWVQGNPYMNQFDLVFIDGLHTAEQVQKDFENALKVLSPHGIIVIHDCNPEKEEHTIVPRPTERGHWNGSCYKFAIELGEYYEKFKTVDIDNGCGVWFNSGSDTKKEHNPPHNWTSFNMLRKELLNLISWDEFISMRSHS